MHPLTVGHPKLPPAISASHTARPPHPPGKVLAQKTADEQLMAQAAQRVQRQAEQAKKKEDEAKKKKKEEEEKRKKKEKEEEEKRKKKEKEEEERRKKKEKEEEEKRRKKAEEEKAEKVMQRALSMSLHVQISSRVLRSVLRVLCLCYASALLFPGQARRHRSRHPSRSSHQSQHRSSLSQSQTSHKNKEVRAVPPHPIRLPRPSSRAEPTRTRRQEMSSCSAEIGPTKTATNLGGSSTAPLRSRQ